METRTCVVGGSCRCVKAPAAARAETAERACPICSAKVRGAAERESTCPACGYKVALPGGPGSPYSAEGGREPAKRSASVSTVEKRTAPDGKAYTREEFIDHFDGTTEWQRGGQDEWLIWLLEAAGLVEFLETLRHEGFTVDALRATRDEELKGIGLGLGHVVRLRVALGQRETDKGTVALRAAETHTGDIVD